MSVNNKEFILVLCKILYNGFQREEKHISGWFCTCDFPYVLDVFFELLFGCPTAILKGTASPTRC